MSDHLKNLHPRLTTSEVCALARWSVDTLRRRRQSGKFPVQPCDRGAELLYPRDEVLRALDLIPPAETTMASPAKPLISVDELRALCAPSKGQKRVTVSVEKIKARQEASRRNKGR